MLKSESHIYSGQDRPGIRLKEIIDLQITAVRNAMVELLSDERMWGFWHAGHQEGLIDAKNPYTLVFFDQNKPIKRQQDVGVSFTPERFSTSVSTRLPNWFFLTNSAPEWREGLDFMIVSPKDTLRDCPLDVNCIDFSNPELEKLLRDLSIRVTPAEIHRRISGGRKAIGKFY